MRFFLHLFRVKSLVINRGASLHSAVIPLADSIAVADAINIILHDLKKGAFSKRYSIVCPLNGSPAQVLLREGEWGPLLDRVESIIESRYSFPVSLLFHLLLDELPQAKLRGT